MAIFFGDSAGLLDMTGLGEVSSFKGAKEGCSVVAFAVASGDVAGSEARSAA